MPRNNELDQQHVLVGTGRGTHVPEDADGAVVGPVVNHVLQDVRVAPLGHGVEKRPLDDPDSVFHMVFRQQGRGSGHYLRQVEQNAAGIWRGIQDGRQQTTEPAAHVDDGGEATEVVRGGHRRDRKRGHARHGVVEDFGEIRLVRQVFERGFAAQRRDDGAAGTDASVR